MKTFYRLFGLLLVIHMATCVATEVDREYNLSKGDVFVIRLVANPSTGYQWSIREGLEKDCLELLDQSYQPAERSTDKPRLGAGGTQIYRFKGKAAGKTVLKLVYQRPGKKDPARVKYFKVSVE